jgi:hypothetical protein
LNALAHDTVAIQHQNLGSLLLHADAPDELLFCDNETNTERLYNSASAHPFYKDGINDYVTRGAKTVNPANQAPGRPPISNGWSFPVNPK